MNNRAPADFHAEVGHESTGIRVALALTLACALAGAEAADLTVRVDARDVERKHVRTDLSLAARPGPLTLVFPAWMPGEHGPTGPIDTLVGMVIRANAQTLTWQRDPLDMFAISIEVPPAPRGWRSHWSRDCPWMKAPSRQVPPAARSWR